MNLSDISTSIIESPALPDPILPPSLAYDLGREAFPESKNPLYPRLPGSWRRAPCECFAEELSLTLFHPKRMKDSLCNIVRRLFRQRQPAP